MKRSMRSTYFQLFAVSTLLSTLSLAPPAARAAVLTPTVADDELATPGAGCSLREAVIQANRNLIVDPACGPAGEDAATDTILLAPGVVYRLTIAGADDSADQGDLDLADNAAILDLIVQGNGATIQNATAPRDRVLQILAQATVNLEGVTIRDGQIEGGPTGSGGIAPGGGILNLGTLAMVDCALIGNRVVGGTGGTNESGGAAQGGGIASEGPLTLTDCLVQGNEAAGGAGGSVTEDFSFSLGGPGQGGGIWTNSPLTLVRTQFQTNRAQGGAGGDGAMFGSPGGLAFGGAVSSSSNVDIADSWFEGNLARGGRGGDVGSGGAFGGGEGAGGALYLNQGLPVVLRGTTLSSNRAEGGVALGGVSGVGIGGGIHKVSGSLRLENSTLSGNAALGREDENQGGGIFLSLGTGQLDSVTVTASTGGGILTEGSVVATNSIVALQASGADCTVNGSAGGLVTSADFNLDSDGSCALSAAHDQHGVSAVDLGLGPLADNGGPTPTHAIAPGRAAYNRGSTLLATDQRGVARPQLGLADVGAFEQQQPSGVAEVPALSTLGLVALGGLLALTALAALRRAPC